MFSHLMSKLIVMIFNVWFRPLTDTCYHKHLILIPITHTRLSACHWMYFTLFVVNFMHPLLCLLCCVCFQSGYLWLQWRWAVCYSCCWLGFVGVSVVLIPAAATSAAGAARTRAAARDTVSTATYRNAKLIS